MIGRGAANTVRPLFSVSRGYLRTVGHSRARGMRLAETPAGPFGHCDRPTPIVSCMRPARIKSRDRLRRRRRHVSQTRHVYTIVICVFRNHPRGTERERSMGSGAQERRLGQRGPAHWRRSEAHYKDGKCDVVETCVRKERSSSSPSPDGSRHPSSAIPSSS